ncbi:MAG: MinD/ParA family protein [Nitrospirae bacterium]|nr:MAG: MinD/ParA family protein [Nitrospirota bacterium]
MKIEGPKIIAVSSGKGGVGKTNFVANLALLYAGMNKKVVIFDADLGLSNIDVLFGLAPRFNLKHVFLGEKKFKDIIIKGPSGLMIIPASSGVRALTNLTVEQKLRLISEVENFSPECDIFLIDTGAGISDNVLFFCGAAQDVVVIVTPEPTSLADAYALIKILSRDFGGKSFRILVNTARSEKEAHDTFRKLYIVADKFLSISLDYLGYLPFDQHVKDSIIAQRGFITMYPNSGFAKKLSEIGRKLFDAGFEYAEEKASKAKAGAKKIPVQFFKKAFRVD